jgi:hypothetical protein
MNGRKGIGDLVKIFMVLLLCENVRGTSMKKEVKAFLNPSKVILDYDILSIDEIGTIH